MFFAGNTKTSCQSLNSLIFFHFQAELESTCFYYLAPKIASFMAFTLKTSYSCLGNYSDHLAVKILMHSFCGWKLVLVIFLIVCILCWRRWPQFVGTKTRERITMLCKQLNCVQYKYSRKGTETKRTWVSKASFFPKKFWCFYNSFYKTRKIFYLAWIWCCIQKFLYSL